MRFLATLFPATLVAAALLGGCASDNLEDLSGQTLNGPCASDTTIVYSYATHIRPIIANNCLRCHDGTFSSRPDYRTYAGVKAKADDVRTRGISRLVGVTAHLDGFIKMPGDGGQLSACDLSAIRSWVRAGAPDN